MNKNIEQIEFKVTGPKGRGAARLDDFLRVAESLRSSLLEVGRCIAPDLDRLSFEIVDLKFSSAFATIRPVISIPDIPTANGIVLVHRQTIQQLQQGGAVDRRLDFPALESFRPCILPLKSKHQPQIHIQGIALTLEFESNLAQMIEPDTSEYGEITGQMEVINLHKSDRFVLYSEHDSSKIVCHFPRNLFEKVKQGLGKRVTIAGMVFFKQGQPAPRRAEVHRIEVCPSTDPAPSLLNLRGKLKGKLKQPSQELIRSLREEWDEA